MSSVIMSSPNQDHSGGIRPPTASDRRDAISGIGPVGAIPALGGSRESTNMSAETSGSISAAIGGSRTPDALCHEGSSDEKNSGKWNMAIVHGFVFAARSAFNHCSSTEPAPFATDSVLLSTITCQ